MNEKKIPAQPPGTLVVLTGGREDRPVSQDKLALTLAAARLLHLVSRDDEALDEVDLEAFEVPATLNKVRSYFRQRGVSFSSNGRPVLPAGELVACDPQRLSREALGHAIGAALDLGLDCEEISGELWISLGGYSYKPGGGPADPVMPIVLALELRTWSLSFYGGGSPFVQLNHPDLVARLESLLDEQKPAGWRGA